MIKLDNSSLEKLKEPSHMDINNKTINSTIELQKEKDLDNKTKNSIIDQKRKLNNTDDIENDSIVEIVQPSAGILKRRKIDLWDTEQLLEYPKNKTSTNLDIFDSYDPSSYKSKQTEYLSILPTIDKIMKTEEELEHAMTNGFFENNLFLQDFIREFQDNFNGRYDERGIKNTFESRKYRLDTRIDGYKDGQYEQHFNQKQQKVSAELRAGEATTLKLPQMAEMGLFELGDIWKYSRTLGFKQRGKGRDKIEIRKDLQLTGIDESTHSLTFLCPSSTNIYFMEGDPGISISNITTPTMLETQILDIDGRTAHSERPNGNAWKSIRVQRRGQDMGTLFEGTIYGKCIVKNANNIQKDACVSEFQNFKNCLEKTIKRKCKKNQSLEDNKIEFFERSKILPQFMPHQHLAKNEHFQKLSNLSNVNYIQSINTSNINYHNKAVEITDECYKEAQDQLLKIQASNNFISNKIEMSKSNIHEHIIMDPSECKNNPETIVSDQKTYELDCQSKINLESISTMNPNHIFSDNNITKISKGNKKASNNISKKDYIPLETNFLKHKSSNSKNNSTTENLSKEEVKNYIPLNLHTEFDNASTLFKTSNNDELCFLKNTSDTLIIQDKNLKNHKNIFEKKNFSTQTNYNDIWKTIGEDTNFLPDEFPYTQYSTSSTNDIKKTLEINTNTIQTDMHYPFYLNNSRSNKTSLFEKPNIVLPNYQFHMYTDNTQLCSSNINSQTNIPNTNKLENMSNQISSEIPTENQFSYKAHIQNQQCVYQQSYQSSNNYFSTTISKQDEIVEKSYISAKGKYLSPYDLPIQIIPKFKHQMNPTFNNYTDIQKRSYSSNNLQTNVNTSGTESYEPTQNTLADENITNNSKMIYNEITWKNTPDQKFLLNYTPINRSTSNTNICSIQQTSKTYITKAEEKNRMFQDLPAELSRNSRITNQNIHKNSCIQYINNINPEIQHPSKQYFVTNQYNLQEIHQNSHEDKSVIFNIIENKTSLENTTSNINSLELNKQEVNSYYFPLNDIKKQDILKKNHIQENVIESNKFIGTKSKTFDKADSHSYYLSMPHYNLEKDIVNKEDLWDSKNNKSPNLLKNYLSTSNYDLYTPSTQQNILSTSHFLSNLDNSYLQSEKQYHTLITSDKYSSSTFPSHSTSPNIHINNSLSNINENSSKEHIFCKNANPIHYKNDFRNSSYPLLAWGFGGKIITIFPNQISAPNATEHIHFNLSNTYGALKISNIKSYIQNSELLQIIIPGPLFSTSKSANKTHKKEAIKWMKKQIQLLELTKNNNEEQKFLDEKILLWKIIYILLENNNSSDQIEAIHSILNLLYSDLQLSNKKESEFAITTNFMNSNSNFNANTREISSYTVTQESLERIKLYLLQGAKNNAIQFCLDKKLWPHAFLISSSINQEAWKYVAKTFIRSEFNISNKNLQSLKFFYETLCENSPETENSIPFFNEALNIESNEINKFYQDHLDNWKETLAIILSNPSKEDSNIIYNLGKYLIKNNYVIAGHICFLLARKDSSFFMHDIPNSDIILLGEDHIKNPSFYRNLDNIILNEILELCTALRCQLPFYGYAHLQAYKFYYTTVLTDFGYISEAQKYCESINDIIKKYSKSSPFFHPLFVQQFQEFSSRFLTCESIDSSSWFGKKMAKPRLDSFWGSIENKFNKFVVGETNSIDSQEFLNNDSKPFIRLGEKIQLSTIQSQDEYLSQQDSQEKSIKTCQNNYQIIHNPSITSFQNYDIMLNQNYNYLTDHPSLPTSNKTFNQNNYHNDDQYYKEIISKENSIDILNEQDPVKNNNEQKNLENNDSNYLKSPNTLSDKSHDTKSELQDFYNIESKSQPLEKNKGDENINSSWFTRWWGKKELSKEKKVYKAKLGDDNSFVYDVELKKWINKKTDTTLASKQNILPPPPPRIEQSHSTESITEKLRDYDESFNKLSSSTSISHADLTLPQLSIESTHKPILNEDTLDNLLEMASKHSLTIRDKQGKTSSGRIKTKSTKDKYVNIMNLTP
ncbi:hypothetical protein PCANB_000865 [Pneumocystis canis]|nr:hypothetical protein PCANB_000865 [Pneumocystis canis]